MLKTRVLTSTVLIAVLLACLFLTPQPVWAGLMVLVLLAAAVEWARLARLRRAPGFVFVASTLILGAGLWALAPEGRLPGVFAAAFAFWLVVVPIWLRLRWRVENPWVLTVTGWVVLLPTWAALVSLRSESPGLLLAVMGVIWVADTAAYFAGRRFGRHKLAPSISPGKTWEGVLGAWLGVSLYGLAAFFLVSSSRLDAPLVMFLLVIWLLAYLSILGDLFESLLKRVAGLKDSGGVFPGHGGVLDRIDGLTAALPSAALLVLVLRPAGVA